MVYVLTAGQETSGCDSNQRFGAGISRRSNRCSGHFDHSGYSIGSLAHNRRRHAQRLRRQSRPSPNRFKGQDRLFDHNAERRQDATSTIESNIRVRILVGITDCKDYYARLHCLHCRSPLPIKLKRRSVQSGPGISVLAFFPVSRFRGARFVMNAFFGYDDAQHSWYTTRGFRIRGSLKIVRPR